MPRQGPGKTSKITRDVGAALRRIREDQQLTQVALARKAGTSRSEINGIESALRAPTIVSLAHLAHALGVPITAFFSDERPPKKTPTAEEAALNRLLLKLRGRDLRYSQDIEAFVRWFDRARR